MRLSEKIQNGSTSQFLNNLNEAQNLKEERKYRNPDSDPKAEDKFIHIEYKEPEKEEEKEEIDECNTKLKEDESETKYKVGDIVKVPYKYGTYTPGEFTEAPIIDIEDEDFVTVEIPSKLTVMMDQIERWNNLEECDTKLDEKYVESFGGDTKDFIDEVNVIKAKLEEIDTESFAAKLSQQVVEDWIETCDRLLERANRLDSGDEFGTKE